MQDIPTFEAKCGNCGHRFSHPSLGDFSYGEALFCTLDGGHYASASAFTDFSGRVRALVRPEAEKSFWSILASLADPISGQSLSSSIRCPHCSSDKLEYGEGRKLGVVRVPEATFNSAAALSLEELAQRVSIASAEAGRLL